MHGALLYIVKCLASLSLALAISLLATFVVTLVIPVHDDGQGSGTLSSPLLLFACVFALPAVIWVVIAILTTLKAHRGTHK
jgi:hypothetical protein